MPAPITVALSHRQIHSIEDAAGWRIACRDGSVWITIDGDLRDYVLERGETFVTSHHARALVYALGNARIDLVACQSRKETMPTLSRFHAMPLMKAAR
jgi:hypothetical protein